MVKQKDSPRKERKIKQEPKNRYERSNLIPPYRAGEFNVVTKLLPGSVYDTPANTMVQTEIYKWRQSLEIQLHKSPIHPLASVAIRSN